MAQLNAEALSALAYTQVIRKGCPAIYGHYLSTVSMKSGAPMAGTPEISLMNFMIGQMARFYGVPWRTSNTLGGAKTFDAQAGYESATTLSAVLHAGANYIWHSAGWNEAGMHCSVAKFVVDAEQCAMGYRMAEGIRWDDFDEALAAVRDVGPGRALSRPSAYAGKFPAGVLHAGAVRQQLDRAMAGRGQRRDHRTRPGPAPASC